MEKTAVVLLISQLVISAVAKNTTNLNHQQPISNIQRTESHANNHNNWFYGQTAAPLIKTNSEANDYHYYPTNYVEDDSYFQLQSWTLSSMDELCRNYWTYLEYHNGVGNPQIKPGNRHSKGGKHQEKSVIQVFPNKKSYDDSSFSNVIGFLAKTARAVVSGRRSSNKRFDLYDFELERTGPLPVVEILPRVNLDLTEVAEELLLTMLEFGAFVACDIVFQVIWPTSHIDGCGRS